eukprot:5633362-Prymnesium_polylepis.2
MRLASSPPAGRAMLSSQSNGRGNPCPAYRCATARMVALNDGAALRRSADCQMIVSGLQARATALQRPVDHLAFSISVRFASASLVSCTRCQLPIPSPSSSSPGQPRIQAIVVLHSPLPPLKSFGWNSWLGFMKCRANSDLAVSMKTASAGAHQMNTANESPYHCLPSSRFSAKVLAEDHAMFLHGGQATTPHHHRAKMMSRTSPR